MRGVAECEVLVVADAGCGELEAEHVGDVEVGFVGLAERSTRPSLVDPRPVTGQCTDTAAGSGVACGVTKADAEMRAVPSTDV
jgi:hypothetical protein